MEPRSYLFIAVAGGLLVVLFSPFFLYLIAEGGLPKMAIERRTLQPQNYTIESRTVYMGAQVELWNESFSVNPVGVSFKVAGDVTANVSSTFMLMDADEYLRFLNQSSYETRYKTSLEPGRVNHFSADLASGSTYDLEVVVIKTQATKSVLDLSLIGSYSVEVVEIDYEPDFVKGVLFPAMFAIGLVLLVMGLIKLRQAARVPTAQYTQATTTS